MTLAQVEELMHRIVVSHPEYADYELVVPCEGGFDARSPDVLVVGKSDGQDVVVFAEKAAHDWEPFLERRAG